MKKVLKIIKCSNETMWYKDNINEQYEFMFIDEATGDYVVNLNNSRGDLGSILIDDFDILEVEDDVDVRPFIEIPNEIDILKEKLIVAEKENLDSLEVLVSLYEELEAIKEKVGAV